MELIRDEITLIRNSLKQLYSLNEYMSFIIETLLERYWERMFSSFSRSATNFQKSFNDSSMRTGGVGSAGYNSSI